jgi:hypothetical protein
MIPPRLREHGSPTQDARTGAAPLGRALDFDHAHAFSQLGKERVSGTELRRKRESELDRVGHPAIGAEEVRRSRRGQGAPGQQSGQAVDARPLVGPLDR